MCVSMLMVMIYCILKTYIKRPRKIDWSKLPTVLNIPFISDIIEHILPNQIYRPTIINTNVPSENLAQYFYSQ